MSTSGPRYHIPFPRTFLSLNTPAHKSTTLPSDATIVPAAGTAAASPPPNNFLSNRASVPRHSSVSSISSSDSTGSAPSSPPSKAADAPVAGQKVPAFLALNGKFEAKPAPAKKMTGAGEKSGFLSNMA